MPRFLHVADVHLGYDKYDSPERTRDFFKAFRDALERYAIGEQVDFVLIAGDLFEHRNVLPGVLNQAQSCLGMLQEAGIPVLAIEGNHDNRPYGTRTSWLRYLADWGWLILLEPNEDAGAGEPLYSPWDAENRRGGYIDLDCGVRVIGSFWCGASAPQAIPLLAAGIQELPPGPDYTVMMFHHGLQGQIARYEGALDPKALAPLKQVGVDYLALGHIHKNYEVDGWIFNPGSIEANSVAEAQDRNPRGAYLVTLENGTIQAELKRDYWQRSMLRLKLEAQKQWTEEVLAQQAIALVQSYAEAGKTQAAIVELRLTGQVGFNRLDLDVKDLREQLLKLSGALLFLLKYDVLGTEYDTVTVVGDEPPQRSEIEHQVFADFLAAHVAYREQTEFLARGLSELKDRLLEKQSDEELYDFVQSLLAPSPDLGEVQHKSRQD